MKLRKNNAKRAQDHLFAAQTTYYEQPLTLVDGQGTRVRDDDGNEYLDGFAGIATNTLGYGDNEVAQAVKREGLTVTKVFAMHQAPTEWKQVLELIEKSQHS